MLLLPLVVMACDPGESQRFRDQQPFYRFEDQAFTLEVRGGRLVETTPLLTPGYSCPAGFLPPGAEVPVFKIDALSPTPIIELTLPDVGPACSFAEQFAIELTGLPIDAIDLYRKCDQTAGDRLVNRCEGAIVPGGCTSDSPPGSCEQVVEGRYELVAWSEYVDDPLCRDAGERQALQLTNEGRPAPEACGVCNVFESDPIPRPGESAEPILTVALRADVPETSETIEGAECCDPDVEPTLAFCIRPCPCRKTFYTLVPTNRVESPPELASFDGALRLAVISEVEGNTGRFESFLAAARAEGVDAVLNIGDLSENGTQTGVRKMADFVTAHAPERDGAGCESDENGLQCCAANERLFPEICNAPLKQPGFMSGLGENETDEESFFTFFEQFGPTNFSTAIGHVELIVLDSADATLSSAQFGWLEEILTTPDPKAIACEIAGTPPGDAWPLAAECSGSCVQCGVGSDVLTPICVPPPRDRSDYKAGDQNCLCLESLSTPCPGNFQCGDSDGDGQSECLCDRDEACGDGGRCVDGGCVSPLRMVFTHTPPFDVFGARNSAFRSRREAARLMSTLASHEVDLVFAGAINTFSEIAVADIPLFITGGGGADLEIFDDTGHHWLLVTIPNAWEAPTLSDVSVELIAL